MIDFSDYLKHWSRWEYLTSFMSEMREEPGASPQMEAANYL